MATFKTKEQYDDDNMTTKDRLIQKILNKIPNTVQRHDSIIGSVFYDANRYEVIKKGFWIWKYEIWKQIHLFDIIENDKEEIFIISYNETISKNMIRSISMLLNSKYTIIYKFIDKPYTVFDTKPDYGGIGDIG